MLCQINDDFGKGYKARGIGKIMLGLWEEAARDLRMATKLDFDEEATVLLRKVRCIRSRCYKSLLLLLFQENLVITRDMKVGYSKNNVAYNSFRLNPMSRRLQNIGKNMKTFARQRSREELSLKG